MHQMLPQFFLLTEQGAMVIIEQICPFVHIQISFPDRPELKVAVLQKQPFVLKRYIIAMTCIELSWHHTVSFFISCSNAAMMFLGCNLRPTNMGICYVEFV